MPKRDFPSDDSTGGTSRRALLRALTAAPTVAALSIPPSWENVLASLHDRYDDEPAALERTKAKRSLSRFRYHNAESFFGSLDRRFEDQRAIGTPFVG